MAGDTPDAGHLPSTAGLSLQKVAIGTTDPRLGSHMTTALYCAAARAMDGQTQRTYVR